VTSVVSVYLERIYTLHAEGEDAYAVTLAEQFGVSRANASATVGRLGRDGLVQVDGRRIALTAQGTLDAEAGLRRHRVTERFLVDVLGMDWATVHDQARSFERGLTPLLEARMDERAGLPRTCPHGNPVPRPDLDASVYLRDRGAMQLATAPTNTPLTILLVSELLEAWPEYLRLCQQRDWLPGTMVTVRPAPDGAALLGLERDGVVIPLEEPLTARIWVVRPEDA